jgi:hypothetical protein
MTVFIIYSLYADYLSLQYEIRVLHKTFKENEHISS